MSSTKEAIITLAEKLIRTKGYNAFSYKDISDPMNIKNAAVHYHFPSKAELGVAVIERNMDRFDTMATSWASLDERTQVESFMKIYQQSSENNLVCFMGALGPSFDTLPTEMQNTLSKASLKIRSWLNGMLASGLQKRTLNFSESIDEKTDLIISSLLSSLILERVTKQSIYLNVSAAINKGL